MGVSADRRQYLHARAAKVEAEGMGAVVDSSLANSYPPQVRRDAKVFAGYRARFLANDAASYAAINRAFAKFDAGADLAAIRCPALVLAGAHDKLRPPEGVRDTAARIAGAGYAVIDSGHIMPVQAPEEMLAAMNAFYDEVAACRGGPENALFSGE
jgi:3-oxoadipate enol-lactonase